MFQYIRQHNVAYGYIWKHYDATQCTKGLWNATRKFIHDQNVQPTFFDSWREPRLFYNNFEISRTDIWRTELYQRYIEYLDSLGGIYYYRWGDATVKGLALSMFVEEKRLHLFEDIAYRHGGFIHTPPHLEDTTGEELVILPNMRG